LAEKKTLPSNRDVCIVDIPGDFYLTIACDSAGGIGEKRRDVVKVPASVVGRFTCRVALMETLAVGAAPKAVAAAVCCEPSPTGEKILAGIREELCEAGLDLPVVISTEKNILTCQTGLGVTVTGIAKKSGLRVNRTRAGDRLYCVGMPRVGNEVKLNDSRIADANLVRKLSEIPCIHDIIPVGSKGIKGEAELLASHLGLSLTWQDNVPLDIKKSAGPATCVLVTSSEDLKLTCSQPVYLLGVIDV
jgi:hypothetical protein